MRTRLDEAEVAAALTSLDGWSGDGAAISRTVVIEADRVSGFLDDLDKLARTLDHDPVVERSGEQVTLTMWTHTVGGVTELDIEYARRANELIAGWDSSGGSELA